MNDKRHIKLYQVLFWSVITAAFIGPGTVTTALKSGALYKLDLLWAVLFSIIACYVLQEAASRITIATGSDLPEIIASRFGNNSILNVHHLLIFGIVFGCIAYQAGNMAGALAGLELTLNISRQWLIIALYLIAFVFLWDGHMRNISRLLGILVGLMAVIFMLLSVHIKYEFKTLIYHLLIPRIPAFSGIYLIGLIGTTIVPYNLFLGSGISHHQNLSDTRFGLGSAILIGGMITLFILLSGTLFSTDFSFNGVYSFLKDKIGNWAGYGFALGLFAAGFTSSITAPLAAAITVKSVIKKLSRTENQAKWYFRGTWLSVLSIGTLFSFLKYQPDVLIVMAQAINGLILPFVAFYLYIILNDRSLLGKKFINAPWYNMITLMVIAVTIFLGLFHFLDVIVHHFLPRIPIIPQMAVALIITGILIFRLIMIVSANNESEGGSSAR